MIVAREKDRLEFEVKDKFAKTKPSINRFLGYITIDISKLLSIDKMKYQNNNTSPSTSASSNCKPGKHYFNFRLNKRPNTNDTVTGTLAFCLTLINNNNLNIKKEESSLSSIATTNNNDNNNQIRELSSNSTSSSTSNSNRTTTTASTSSETSINNLISTPPSTLTSNCINSYQICDNNSSKKKIQRSKSLFSDVLASKNQKNTFNIKLNSTDNIYNQFKHKHEHSTSNDKQLFTKRPIHFFYSTQNLNSNYSQIEDDNFIQTITKGNLIIFFSFFLVNFMIQYI
jgi:hypothetical protein